MHVIVALDKFKGTLTALEACQATERGLTAALEKPKITLCPIADGGEGTVEALAARLSGEMRGVLVDNAMASRQVPARYLLVKSESRATAYLELASASGLALLKRGERDPLRATTYGSGQLMKAAVEGGADDIVIGLGGSATNDGGLGLARAWGYGFFAVSGSEILVPRDLVDLGGIEPPDPGPDFACLVLADVTNPLLGSRGATAVYGPQKGVAAGTAMVLEAGLERLADVVARDLAKDLRHEAGAGAAGGCGFGLMSFFGAELVPGFEYVSEQLGLEQAIEAADLVITGEGRMDGQTLSGKGPAGVAALAQKHGKPVIAVCGDIEPSARLPLSRRFTSLVALTDGRSLDEALADPAGALEVVARRLGREM